MSRRHPGPCPLCRYPQVQSGEIVPSGLTPMPRCLNHVCPTRPQCTNCGSEATHKTMMSKSFLCQQCSQVFQPE